MIPPERVNEFSHRPGTAFGYVLKPLPDALFCVRPRGDVQQTLISFRVLHDGGSLAVNGQNKRAFRFFQLLKKGGGVVAKRRQGLNVLRNIHRGCS